MSGQIHIFMKLYRNVYQVKTMCHIQLWLLSVLLFQSYGPLIVFMLILCNFHSCTHITLVTVWDVLMKYYENVN